MSVIFFVLISKTSFRVVHRVDWVTGSLRQGYTKVEFISLGRGLIHNNFWLMWLSGFSSIPSLTTTSLLIGITLFFLLLFLALVIMSFNNIEEIFWFVDRYSSRTTRHRVTYRRITTFTLGEKENNDLSLNSRYSIAADSPINFSPLITRKMRPIM